MDALGLFIQILAYVLIAAIFLRIIFSWINFDPTNPIYTVIHEITEPILAPLRSILPRMSMFDLSPMVASFILFFLASLGGTLRN
ncbi:MAG: YggT family protein [Chloroflexota bacterium]